MEREADRGDQASLAIDMIEQHAPGTVKGVDGQSVDETMMHPSTTASDPKSTLKAQSSLLSLPQEILDIIMNFAYPRIESFKIKSLAEWAACERLERRSRGSAYSMRPPPAPKVDDWLVSRKFLVSAAQTFIGNQVFNRLQSISQFHLKGLGVMHFVKTMLLHIYPLTRYENLSMQFPHLKFVTAVVPTDLFDILEPRFAWEISLEDSELEAVADASGIDHLFTLRGFSARPGYCTYAMTATQETTWKQNAERLEPILRKRVICERSGASQHNSRSCNGPMLYPGSKVYLDSAMAEVSPLLHAPTGPSESKGTKRKRPVFMSPIVSTPNARPVQPQLRHSVSPHMDFQPNLTLQDIPTDLEALKRLVNSEPEKMGHFLHVLRMGGFDTQLLGNRPFPHGG